MDWNNVILALHRPIGAQKSVWFFWFVVLTLRKLSGGTWWQKFEFDLLFQWRQSKKLGFKLGGGGGSLWTCSERVVLGGAEVAGARDNSISTPLLPVLSGSPDTSSPVLVAVAPPCAWSLLLSALSAVGCWSVGCCCCWWCCCCCPCSCPCSRWLVGSRRVGRCHHGLLLFSLLLSLWFAWLSMVRSIRTSSLRASSCPCW